MKQLRYFLLPALVLLCVGLALAQDEEQLVESYMSFDILPSIIKTVMWSALYLGFYIIVPLVVLGLLRQLNGFETEHIIWIVLLWLGGMVVNFVAYKYGKTPLYAGLLAVPMLFAWGLLINTRNFMDLLFKDALIVSAVVALLCAPWLGPSWRVEKKTVKVESRLTVPAPQPVALLIHTSI